MNDKEMIEEMAEELSHDIFEDENETIMELSRHLVAKGYRKIPEGSVVLTSEQYSNYLILQTNEEWLKNKVTELQTDNKRLYKNIGKFKESVRKETAEKFAEKVQDYLNDKVCEEFGDYACDVTYFTIDVDKVISDVFEIAEQFGVEV